MNGNGTFRVEVENIDNVIRLLRKYPTIATKHVEECLAKSTVAAQRDIRVEAPVDRNRLRNSIVITRDGRYAYAVGTNVKYSMYVHEGTRPHRMPFEPIQKWASRKGIPWFPVWKKIAEKGTKPNPFFERGVKKAEPEIQRYFRECEDNIVRDLNRGKP